MNKILSPLTSPPDPGQWVAAYADYLYAFAIARINDEELARDLVQETFLAALERIDRFEGRSAEKTWLTAILKNKVIDVYRKRASSPLQTPQLQNEPDFFDAETGHWKEQYCPQEHFFVQHDALAAKEFNHILEKCMQKLPALWLSVFTMKHMDDETSEFICSTLQLSSSNFWVIIHRAKLNLRACLQKNW